MTERSNRNLPTGSWFESNAARYNTSEAEHDSRQAELRAKQALESQARALAYYNSTLNKNLPRNPTEQAQGMAKQPPPAPAPAA